MEITFEDEIYKEEKLKEKWKLLQQVEGNNECVECGMKSKEKNAFQTE